MGRPGITDGVFTGPTGGGDTLPFPGGTWEIPAEGRPMDHVRALIQDMGIPPEERSAYLQALVRENGPPQPSQVLRLPQHQSAATDQPQGGQPVDHIVEARTPQMLRIEASGTGPTIENRGGGSVNLREGGLRIEQPAVESFASPTSPPVDIDAGADRLAEAVRRNDTATMFDIFHGKSKATQQAIIRAFDRLPIRTRHRCPPGQRQPAARDRQWHDCQLGAASCWRHAYPAQ